MKKACETNDKESGNALDAVVSYETLLMENLVDRVLPLLAVSRRVAYQVAALMMHHPIDAT